MSNTSGEIFAKFVDVVKQLQDRAVGEQRLQELERLAELHLPLGPPAAENVAFPRAVPQRQVGAVPRRGREAEADEIGDLVVEAGGLGIGGDDPRRMDRRDPALQVARVADDLVG